MISGEAKAYLDSLGMFGWRLGLDTIRTLTAELHEPQQKFRTIHLAGSNGKGSAARMIEAILLQAGYRTGLYTSPHLVTPLERIRVAGQQISHTRFEETIREIRPVLTAHRATYFEALTALAFLHFAREKVDIAIVETGLGGRLDATNIVDPLCSVITSISLEHCNYLGDTLAAIAAEKAGIIKKERPCILGTLPAEAEQVILAQCRNLNSKASRAHEIVTAKPLETVKWGGTEAQFEFADARCTALVKLPGTHQLENTKLAIAASLLIEPPQKIAALLPTAFADLTIPGRMQLFARHPDVILDVAHNPESMGSLAQTLSATLPGKPVELVLGLLKDKDVAAIFAALRPVCAKMYCVTPRSDRARTAESLQQKAQAAGFDAASAASVADAVARARRSAGQNGAVVVAGSHYVVGEFLETVKS